MYPTPPPLSPDPEWDEQKLQIEEEKRAIKTARSQLRLEWGYVSAVARELESEKNQFRALKQVPEVKIINLQPKIQGLLQELEARQAELTLRETCLAERESAVLKEHGGREGLTRQGKEMEKTLQDLWAWKKELNEKEASLRSCKRGLTERERTLEKLMVKKKELEDDEAGLKAWEEEFEALIKEQAVLWSEGKEGEGKELQGGTTEEQADLCSEGKEGKGKELQGGTVEEQADLCSEGKEGKGEELQGSTMEEQAEDTVIQHEFLFADRSEGFFN